MPTAFSLWRMPDGFTNHTDRVFACTMFDTDDDDAGFCRVDIRNNVVTWWRPDLGNNRYVSLDGIRYSLEDSGIPSP